MFKIRWLAGFWTNFCQHVRSNIIIVDSKSVFQMNTSIHLQLFYKLPKRYLPCVEYLKYKPVKTLCYHIVIWYYDCYWSRQLLVYWTELINHYSLYTCIIIPNTVFFKLKIRSPVFLLKNLTSTNLTIMAAAKHIQLNMSVTLNTVSIRHQGRFHPVVLHQTVHV